MLPCYQMVDGSNICDDADGPTHWSRDSPLATVIRIFFFLNLVPLAIVEIENITWLWLLNSSVSHQDPSAAMLSLAWLTEKEAHTYAHIRKIRSKTAPCKKWRLWGKNKQKFSSYNHIYFAINKSSVLCFTHSNSVSRHTRHSNINKCWILS